MMFGTFLDQQSQNSARTCELIAIRSKVLVLALDRKVLYGYVCFFTNFKGRQTLLEIDRQMFFIHLIKDGPTIVLVA